MEQTDIRFGILGCGLAAGFHANAIAAVPGAVLAGVCDAAPLRAEAFASAYGCKACGSFEAFASDKTIDAVCVCTPSGYHAQSAVELLSHGKDLLIEKPLAVDLRQAGDILEAQKRSGRTVGVVSQLRCFADVQKLKAAVDAGELGRLVTAQLSMLYHRSEAYYRDSSWHGTLALDGGGALINQGIHGVDLLLWLLGRVRSVRALSATLRHQIEAEDTIAALLEFENGCFCTVTAATSVWPGQPRVLTLCGTDGTAVLTEDKLTTMVTCAHGDTTADGRPSDYLSHNDPGAIPPQAHENVIADFCDALRHSRAPVSDITDGFNALALIRAVYDSARSGEPCVPEYLPKGDDQ